MSCLEGIKYHSIKALKHDVNLSQLLSGGQDGVFIVHLPGVIKVKIVTVKSRIDRGERKRRDLV